MCCPCCPRRLASPVLRFFAGCCCRFCSALGWSPTLGLIAGTSSLAPKVVVLRPKQHGRCALTSHAATAIGELHAASNTADCPRQPSPPRVAPSTIGIVNKKSDRGNLRNKRHKLNPSNNNRALGVPSRANESPCDTAKLSKGRILQTTARMSTSTSTRKSTRKSSSKRSQNPSCRSSWRTPRGRFEIYCARVAVFSGPGARSLQASLGQTQWSCNSARWTVYCNMQ